MRCGACHVVTPNSEALPAPALDQLAGNLSREWLVGWLTAEPDPEATPQLARRMPHFDLDRGEAAAIADYLQGRTLLLVLDNFEHLPDAADIVAQLLQPESPYALNALTRKRL